MSVAAPPVQHQPRRTASLAMLIFAVVIAVTAFAQVGLARDGKLPVGMLGYGLGLGVLVGVGFFVQSRFAPYADPLLLPLATALNGLGLAMIYRLDQKTSEDYQKAKDAGRDLSSLVGGADAMGQLLWTALSMVLFVGTVVFLRDPTVLKRYMFTLGLGGLFFLALPAAPGIGQEINGARLWIKLPGIPQIQPGEFAKVLLVVFFAGYLVNKRSALALIGKKLTLAKFPNGKTIGIALPRFRDLGPILIMWVFSLGILVVEKDLGSALLFFGLFVTMLYVATERVSWVLIGLGLFASGVFVATLLPFLGHVNDRIQIWLDPEPYYDRAFGGSEQLMKGQFALGEGGVLGTGLGQGQPWWTPNNYDDFIIASLGEELGLTGLMVILLLYVLIVQRAMKAALDTRDSFAKLFTGGIAFVLALQVFIMVGGVTRLIPLTGLTTPFLSQGGSSLLANWILIGMLVRISHMARKPAPQSIQAEGMTQVVKIR